MSKNRKPTLKQQIENLKNEKTILQTELTITKQQQDLLQEKNNQF